jgi:hypothetical protein
MHFTAPQIGTRFAGPERLSLLMRHIDTKDEINRLGTALRIRLRDLTLANMPLLRKTSIAKCTVWQRTVSRASEGWSNSGKNNPSVSVLASPINCDHTPCYWEIKLHLTIGA